MGNIVEIGVERKRFVPPWAVFLFLLMAITVVKKHHRKEFSNICIADCYIVKETETIEIEREEKNFFSFHSLLRSVFCSRSSLFVAVVVGKEMNIRKALRCVDSRSVFLRASLVLSLSRHVVSRWHRINFTFSFNFIT
jgi:hypothetical protein